MSQVSQVKRRVKGLALFGLPLIQYSNKKTLFINYINFPSVLRRCWLGDRKDIRPVNSWVLVC